MYIAPSCVTEKKNQIYWITDSPTMKESCWEVLQCVAVCCSMLQCVAVCCGVLQRSVLQCVAACCNVLQCVHGLILLRRRLWWYVRQPNRHLSILHEPLQHTATHCNTLQHTTTHCNTLQHTATHCNNLTTVWVWSAKRAVKWALLCYLQNML